MHRPVQKILLEHQYISCQIDKYWLEEMYKGIWQEYHPIFIKKQK